MLQIDLNVTWLNSVQNIAKFKNYIKVKVNLINSTYWSSSEIFIQKTSIYCFQTEENLFEIQKFINFYYIHHPLCVCECDFADLKFYPS